MMLFGTLAMWALFVTIYQLIIMFDTCACSGSYGTSFLTSFLYDQISESHSLTILSEQVEDVECNYTYNGTSKSLTVQDHSIYEEFNNSFATNISGINGNTFYLTTNTDASVISRGSNQDSSLLLPTDGFGKEYYLPFFQLVAGHCFYAVYAVHDNTIVVTSPQGSVVWNGTNYASGKIITIFVNSYETATITGNLNEDLTSTLVISNQPVGVTVWVEGASVPTNSSSEVQGNMAEAISPKQSWGKLFVVFPMAAGRLQGEVIRVLGYTLTNVTFTQSTGEMFHVAVDSKAYAEVDTGNLSSQHLIVTSDYPILVALYAKSGIYNNITTTPFMMEVPPVEQWRDSYVFAFLGPSASSENYINIICRVEHADGISLSSKSGITDVVVHQDWETTGGSFKGKIFQIRNNSSYIVTHAEASVQFGVFMYGYNSIQSFGHPAGRNLAKLYGNCVSGTASAGDGLDNDCDGRVDEEVLDGVDDDGDGAVDEDVARIKIVSSSSSSSLQQDTSSSVEPFESETPLSSEITYSVSSLMPSSLDVISSAVDNSETPFISTTNVFTIDSASSIFDETTNTLFTSYDASELPSSSLSTDSLLLMQSSSVDSSEMEPDLGTSLLFSESLNASETITSKLTTLISSTDNSFESLEATNIQSSIDEVSSPVQISTYTFTATASTVELNSDSSQMLSVVTQDIAASSVGTTVVTSTAVLSVTTEALNNKSLSTIDDSQGKTTLISALTASIGGPIILGGIVTVVYKMITKLRAPKSHQLDQKGQGQSPKENNLKHTQKQHRKIFVQPQENGNKSIERDVSRNKHLVITPLQARTNIEF